MTMPDPALDRTGAEEQGVRDRLPPNERGQDPERTEISHGLAVDGSRPLTGDERAAAEHDTPVAERVFAPASERVPRDPVPGHRDFVEHTDDSTPERRAASHNPEFDSPIGGEPSFTRVERPSTGGQSAWPAPPSATRSNWLGMPMGVGSLMLVAFGGLGVWLYVRWQRERNKPINRLRRQALQTASDLRQRVPATDDLGQRGGAGALVTLLSIALVVAQRMRAQRAQQPLERISDADWQQRLHSLRDRWSPRRVELEKFSISRH